MSNLWITGGTGFLGSHLVRRFASIGNSVTVLKRTSSMIRRVGNIGMPIHFIDLDRNDVHGIIRSNWQVQTEPSEVLND